MSSKHHDKRRDLREVGEAFERAFDQERAAIWAKDADKPQPSPKPADVIDLRQEQIKRLESALAKRVGIWTFRLWVVGSAVIFGVGGYVVRLLTE